MASVENPVLGKHYAILF